MKQTALDRYETTGDGSVIIDVSATRVEDLFNNFDRSAPYIRRDLDQQLVDYLIDCAKEINRDKFVLRFTLRQPPDDTRQSRIKQSVKAFFLYLAASELQQVSQMFRRSAILFSIGLGILFISVFVNQRLGVERSVAANVFAEGLNIAAWVSLWESLAVFLIEWFPLRINIVRYRRLADAKLMFRTEQNTGLAENNKLSRS